MQESTLSYFNKICMLIRNLMLFLLLCINGNFLYSYVDSILEYLFILGLAKTTTLLKNKLGILRRYNIILYRVINNQYLSGIPPYKK